MHLKSKTVCFTGKRPQNLPWGFNEEHPDCIRLKKELECEIEKSVIDGFTHFISGMALGVDTWAAEIVLELKNQYPYVTLEAALPCEGQANNWNVAARERYFNILAQCDKVTYISRRYNIECMRKRNRYMIDKSKLCIAVYDGSGGGTWYTLEYARIKGAMVRLITP